MSIQIFRMSFNILAGFCKVGFAILYYLYYLQKWDEENLKWKREGDENEFELQLMLCGAFLFSLIVDFGLKRASASLGF
jgi:hypothetical protein